MPKKHRARRAVLAGAAAAGMSGALVLGHATNTTADMQLANTVIGIGGQGDPLSANVPAKLLNSVVPAADDYAYYPVLYPATISLDTSRDIAVPIVHARILAGNTPMNTETHIIVAGYSLGTLAAEQEKRNLQLVPAAQAPSTNQLTFVMIASPFAGNGGIFARFPGVGIPGITAGMGAAQPSRYNTTYTALEYDVYADFPAYFNPLSLLNSALAIRYAHPDAYYDPIEPGVTPAYVTTVPSHDEGAGGTSTYILYYNQHLPLLAPLRELSSMTMTSALTEPLLSAIEPALRVLVDMGYTDRVNANPATAVPFSFITPPAKLIEALAALPAALAQGATNLAAGGSAAVTPPDPIGNLRPAPVVQPFAATESQRGSTSRLAVIPSEQSEPEEDSGKKDPVKVSPAIVPPVIQSTPPGTTISTSTKDGLHPTLIDDGHMFVPGGTQDSPEASSTSPATTTAITTPNPTTTTTITTPATGTVASETTSGEQSTASGTAGAVAAA